MGHAASDSSTDFYSSIVQVPVAQAPLENIVEFSNTFDAYGVHGSPERIAVVATRVWEARASGTLADCDLDDLRTALFMTQRGWSNSCGCESPIGVEWDLVNAIHAASGGFVRDDRPILL